jgi:hypothetical protein
VAYSCEHGNEPTGSIKVGEFLEKVLKKASVKELAGVQFIP